MSATSTRPPPAGSDFKSPLKADDVPRDDGMFHVCDANGRTVARCAERELAVLFEIAVNARVAAKPDAKLVLYARVEHSTALPTGGELKVSYPADAGVATVLDRLERLITKLTPPRRTQVN
ncbi:MAG: hypothetical protein KF764_08720 [Labilithrix sp.]|nr:hypothetical protein [Labilithrix sp.]